MDLDPSKLEPAPRDPKALRRTALILTGLILAGAILVPMAYRKLLLKQAEEFRPAYAGRLVHNLGVVRQDGSTAGLFDLAGDVWVVSAVCLEQPESWRSSREVMLRLRDRYAGREDFHLVCLTVDPENERPERLDAAAEELGARLPGWWMAAAGEEYVHKYLKNKLKLGTLPHRDESGQWVYDPAIVVVDRDLHLRRMKVAFDFDAAAGWDGEGKKTGSGRSNVEELEVRLHRTIDHLLEQAVAES